MAGMTYRGFDSRTSLTRWGLAAVAVGIVAGATVPGTASGIAAVVDGNRASLPWLLERLFAFLAYLALTGSVMYGLLLSTKVLDHLAHRPVSFLLHKDLAAIGVGLAAIHGVLLGLDQTVPFSMRQILVPGAAPHATLAVAFGQVALYLALVVTGSFYLRRRIGHRAWRALHYLTFLAFLGATVHGIAAGTDSSSGWATAIYMSAATAVTFLLVYRIVLSLGQRLADSRTGSKSTNRRPTSQPTPIARIEGTPQPGEEAEVGDSLPGSATGLMSVSSTVPAASRIRTASTCEPAGSRAAK
jgi:hypothetical protein